MKSTLKYSPNQNAHRFTMWLVIVSIGMIFAGFTSAFLVRKGAAGNWTSFNVPTEFTISTLLIILSSIALYVAHISNKKHNEVVTSIGLFITLVLGIAFCFFQYNGWKELVNMGIYLSYNPNPAGPFFYVITGIHVLHVAFGVLFLFIAFIKSILFLRLKRNSNDILNLLENQEKGALYIRTDLLSMYWHFIGILWIYLFIFLSLNLK